MNIKAIMYKALKNFFVLTGFPLMIIIMIITMAPMFDAEVMGNYARNWIIGFVAMWVALLIINFLLETFIGKKSRTHHKVVLVVMAALSILSILLPTVIYDAAMRPKYEAAQNELVGDVDVKSYESVQGWHRDFTERYESDVYVLINENYDFCKLYGLKGIESEWYSNADKEHNLGYKYGSFEKAQKLTEEKLIAKQKLADAQAELAAIEAEIAAKEKAVATAQAALAADPGNTDLQGQLSAAQEEYANILVDMDDDLVRLKGQRVDITDYKDELVDLVIRVINDAGGVLPDGLTIRLLGIDIPVADLLDTVMGLAGDFISADMLKGIIPDVIYTGIGAETISTYESAVDGSDGDVSLAEAQKLNFKFEYYPSVLASGAVKFASYICVGLVVFSLFAADNFRKKMEDEENSDKEEESYVE